MDYKPPDSILEKYARLIVDFALGGGTGIKPKDVVFIQVPECAKPMLVHLRRAVLRSGGFPITQYIPDGIEREYYLEANDEQLSFFPSKYLKGKVEEMDHVVGIIADTNLHELEGIPPEKLMRIQKAMKPYKEWRDEKENSGKLTWNLALYGTEAMAAEAKMTIKEYWEQIITACYLDEPDPIAKWKSIKEEVERIKKELNSLSIVKLFVEAKDTEITVGIGKGRKWLGCDGRNIPSFEIFISPDWRLTHGKIFFNEPLYRYGNLIKDVHLEFEHGRVVHAKARTGEEVLQEMIKVENADKIGEFSLTDSRLSRITKFMAETLFDENVGGEQGNTHMAIGSAYKDCYPGDPSEVTEAGWKELGYNESVIHTDIISTTKRTVTAFLENGEKKVIYKDGKFVI
jgi:aminopeptidase